MKDNEQLNYLTEIVNDVDMFIIDIKTLNESVYKKYTNLKL